MSEKRTIRLTRAAWLDAGIDKLRKEGAGALKAEPMARHLRTTKGSFYWHFKDVPDFHATLLTLWEDAATSELRRVEDTEPKAVPRLRALAQSMANPHRQNALASEPAIRAWASTSPMARNSVTRVDTARLSALTQTLVNIGISNPEAAHIIYAAATGMALLDEQDQSCKTDAIGTLVDLFLAL